jgi:DNA modification methylase
VPDLKRKDLVGIPWQVAFALRQDGWFLRSDIVWHKPNATPESVKDRPTRSHEFVFLLAKSRRYFYDHAAVAEPAVAPRRESADPGRMRRPAVVNLKGRALPPSRVAPSYVVEHNGKPLYLRNRRSVWTLPTRPYRGAHFATYPPDLVRPCIRAGCPVGGTVIDPFMGAGTTGLVALEEGRRFVGIELNAEYVKMAAQRLGL